MKRYFLPVLFVILFFLNNTVCFSASLNSFAVEAAYLQANGRVAVNSSSQNILVDISITRGILPHTNFYETVDWTVAVVLTNLNTHDQTIISLPTQITTADFSGAFCNKTISAQVPGVQYDSYTASGTIYNSTISLIYSPNNYTASNSSTPYYSVNSYLVSMNVNNGPTGAIPPVNQRTIWNGYVYNPIFYGYAVPFPIAQNYHPNDPTFGNWYGSFDWNTSGYVAGTIFNITNDGTDNTPFLTTNESIFSPNKEYRLTMQTDGNLVLYQEAPNLTETALWSTLTQNTAAVALFYQTDGHLILRSGTTHASTSIWHSGLYDQGGALTRFAKTNESMAYPYYKLQNDGNLVMYWPNGVESVASGPASPMQVIFAATDSGTGQSTIVSKHQGSIAHPLTGVNETACNYFEITH